MDLNTPFYKKILKVIKEKRNQRCKFILFPSNKTCDKDVLTNCIYCREHFNCVFYCDN